MIDNLPILEDGGPITIPNPKQFTFNPQGINPNALRFAVNTQPTNINGIIQADQFQQRMGLQQQAIQARIARDQAALKRSQGLQNQKIADNILKSYRMDTAKVAKNLGLDRSNLRDRAILDEIDGKINDYTQQMTDVTLRYKANPSVLNTELAAVKQRLLDDIYNTEGLAEQQNLNAQMLAFQDAVKGREFSSNRAGEVILDFVRYKNNLSPTARFDIGRLNPTEYLDTAQSTFNSMQNLGKGLYTTRRSIESEGGYDFDVERVVTPDQQKIEEVQNEIFNLARNNPDFLNSYKGQIGDITSDDDIRDFANNFVSGFRREIESKLGDRRKLGKTDDSGDKPIEELKTADDIFDAFEFFKQAGKNAPGAKAMIRRLLSQGFTPEEILNDHEEDIRKEYDTKPKKDDSDGDEDGDDGKDNNIVSYSLPNGTTVTRFEQDDIIGTVQFNGNDLGDGIDITERNGEKVLRVEEGTIISGGDRRDKVAELMGVSKSKDIDEILENFDSEDGYFYIPLTKGKTTQKTEGDLGFRNNNPGNLRKRGAKKGFRTFDTLEEGFEAMKSDLRAKINGRSDAMKRYYKENNIDSRDATLVDLISVYAPPSENDTDSYIDSVATQLGVRRDISLSDLDLNDLALAMIKVESPDSYKELTKTGQQNVSNNFGRLNNNNVPRISSLDSSEFEKQINSLDLSKISTDDLAYILDENTSVGKQLDGITSKYDYTGTVLEGVQKEYERRLKTSSSGIPDYAK